MELKHFCCIAVSKCLDKGLTKVNVHIHQAVALESQELTGFKPKTCHPDS